MCEPVDAVGPNEQRLTKVVEKLIRCSPEKTERHSWMYDFVSLKRPLADLGFVNCGTQSVVTSVIPGWKEFRLDANKDDIRCKPESLYMEAVHPHEA